MCSHGKIPHQTLTLDELLSLKCPSVFALWDSSVWLQVIWHIFKTNCPMQNRVNKLYNFCGNYKSKFFDFKITHKQVCQYWIPSNNNNNNAPVLYWLSLRLIGTKTPQDFRNNWFDFLEFISPLYREGIQTRPVSINNI